MGEISKCLLRIISAPRYRHIFFKYPDLDFYRDRGVSLQLIWPMAGDLPGPRVASGASPGRVQRPSACRWRKQNFIHFRSETDEAPPPPPR